MALVHTKTIFLLPSWVWNKVFFLKKTKNYTKNKNQMKLKLFRFKLSLLNKLSWNKNILVPCIIIITMILLYNVYTGGSRIQPQMQHN